MSIEIYFSQVDENPYFIVTAWVRWLLPLPIVTLYYTISLWEFFECRNFQVHRTTSGVAWKELYTCTICISHICMLFFPLHVCWIAGLSFERKRRIFPVIRAIIQALKRSPQVEKVIRVFRPVLHPFRTILLAMTMHRVVSFLSFLPRRTKHRTTLVKYYVG